MTGIGANRYRPNRDDECKVEEDVEEEEREREEGERDEE
jgi:hypothetical protein